MFPITSRAFFFFKYKRRILIRASQHVPSRGRGAGELESNIVPVVFIPQPWNGSNVASIGVNSGRGSIKPTRHRSSLSIPLVRTLFSFLTLIQNGRASHNHTTYFLFPCSLTATVCWQHTLLFRSVNATGHCLTFSFFFFVLVWRKMSLEFNFLNRQTPSHRAVNEQLQQPRWKKKKKGASHLMKSVEVRYSSSSRMDEIEPMRDDYICRWEINFNVQLSSPCEQLDRLDFKCWNVAHPSRRPPTTRRCFQPVLIFFPIGSS